MSSRGIKQVQESRTKITKTKNRKQKAFFFLENDLEKIIKHSEPRARRYNIIMPLSHPEVLIASGTVF